MLASTEDDDDDDEPACFPADATVETPDGRLVRMDALRTGERVRVGRGFSEVVLWTHRDSSWVGDVFVQVRLGDGRAVKATRGHLVYVVRSGTEQVVALGDVRVGDGMFGALADGGEGVVRVTHVARVTAKGLFNPQTAAGDIVVDGVRVTCYTKAVPAQAAHALLAPVRWIAAAAERLEAVSAAIK